jgi:hypothetical protein
LRFADFIVIGAMKAGTTSLYDYLNNHPQIYLHPAKELAFFAKPENKGRAELYARQFERAPDESVIGDVSTQYAKHPLWTDVPRRMAELVPEARLVYMVRDPIARIESHYHHELLGGADLPPIDEDVRQNPLYVQVSSYAMQLALYEPHFRRDQMLVVVMEEFMRDKRTWMRTIFEHIGCDPEYVPTNLDTQSNVSSKRRKATPMIRRIQANRLYNLVRWRVPRFVKRPIVRLLSATPPSERPRLSPETRAWLADQLRDDVQKLTDYLCRDEPIWNWERD